MAVTEVPPRVVWEILHFLLLELCTALQWVEISHYLLNKCHP